MNQYVHTIPLWAILFSLMIFLPLCVRLGIFFARLNMRNNSNFIIDDAIPTSILGVHALLLGFTFSMSVERFEARRENVVREANAIGTAYLRSQLLMSPFSQQSEEWFHSYLKNQMAFSHSADTPENLLKQSGVLKQEHDKIWLLAKELTQKHRTPIESLYVDSLNTMIDIHNERIHSLQNRLPITVLVLVILTLVASLVCFGFVEGSKKQGSFLWLYVLSILFAIVISLVMDLDRPRQGLISVPQLAMEELFDSLVKARSP